MALPQCMSNDGQQAVFVGTFLQNGDAVALCEDCLPAFTATITADMFGVDGQQLLTWLQENAGDEPPANAEQVAEVAAPPAMLADPTPADADAPAAQEGTDVAPEDADGADESPPPAESEAEQVAGE